MKHLSSPISFPILGAVVLFIAWSTALAAMDPDTRPGTFGSFNVKHNDQRYKHKCDWQGCTKKYVRRPDLKAHILLKHPEHPLCAEFDKNAPYACSFKNCTRKFTREILLTRHINKDHAEIFICKDCGMDFKSRTNFRLHGEKYCEKIKSSISSPNKENQMDVSSDDNATKVPATNSSEGEALMQISADENHPAVNQQPGEKLLNKFSIDFING